MPKKIAKPNCEKIFLPLTVSKITPLHSSLRNRVKHLVRPQKSDI